MKLTVENLGPIKAGTIDLGKKLIIITGPNNTGKSYLTYLIHGVSQYQVLGNILNSTRILLPLFNKVDNITNDIEQGNIINILSIVKSKWLNIEEMLENLIRSNFTKIFASSTVKPEIKFDIENRSHIMAGTKYEKIKVVDNNIYIFSSKAKGYTKKIDLDTVNNLDRFPTITERISQLTSLMASVSLDYEIPTQAYFFPAERTAINLFAKHIISTKAEIKDDFDSEAITVMSDEELGRRLRAQVKAAPKYPYAIRDYIHFVNDFKKTEDEGTFSEIANKIERVLAGGTIKIDSLDQVTFTPSGSQSSLELHLSSSLVKSLSYLILYLRYTATIGDQVIVDEPELNLHPDIQVAFARIIAEMVNLGLKVIISTHSDYFIKELNNLILLHDLNNTETGQVFTQEKGYTAAQLLDKNEVGAYYLHDNTITAIDIKEHGIVVPSINDTINAIDSLTEEILYQL